MGEAESLLVLAMLPRDADDQRDVILEVRPGTGGDEAALFAGDLLAMYRGYAGRCGWRFQVRRPGVVARLGATGDGRAGPRLAYLPAPPPHHSPGARPAPAHHRPPPAHHHPTRRPRSC
jgi:hypothetical protein